MQTVNAHGVDLVYDTFGDRNDPAVLLIMGFGVQMVAWDDEFCTTLADRGYYVVRFDNRDVGLSQKFDELGMPDMIRLFIRRKMGQRVSAPYLLQDMAGDVIGLMDALGIESAHLVGVSMGGMIAQVVALRAANRVRSLGLWMTSDGREHGRRSLRALSLLAQRPPKDKEARIDRGVQVWQALNGRNNPIDEDRIRRYLRRAYDRTMYTRGAARHGAAIMAEEPRHRALRHLRIPTVVIHGADDELIPPEHGRALADVIPDAIHVELPETGHTLPRYVWDAAIEAIDRNARRPKPATR